LDDTEREALKMFLAVLEDGIYGPIIRERGGTIVRSAGSVN
jgi:hypothetical protein